MKALLVLAALGLALESQPSAAMIQSAPPGPDISGRWTRSIGEGSVADARFGSQIDISQSNENLTIRRSSDEVEKHRLNGMESAEVLSISGCSNITRITKAEASRATVTLTTWVVTKVGCFHGEDEDFPLISQKGPILMSEVRGSRKLEMRTVIYRDGDSLIVETTRPSFPTGTTTNSTTYRK